MQNILLVRTSSMGDLVHTLPAITDLSIYRPDIKLTWLVEESFVDIAKLHPFIYDVLPIKWRLYFKNITSINLLIELIKLRKTLKDLQFDFVIDSQGLLKSAIPAHWTGSKVAGYDRFSIKEPIASYFYHYKYTISRNLSAIERNRQLFGLAFNYKPNGPVCFSIVSKIKPLCCPSDKYIVLLHSASRDSKLWPNNYWIKLANLLYINYGLVSVLPWGNKKEEDRAKLLSLHIKKSILAPKLTLAELAGLLNYSKLVIGVDTGLLHLANALNIPLVGLYVDTNPELTGVIATPISFNLGGINQLPKVDDVLLKIRSILT